MSPLRWGIAGAGTISHDFVCALSTLPESDHRVVAIAARGLENAQKFADQHGIPVFTVGYEALAKNPHVDIVYIGTVNSLHYEHAMMMLDAGKHVLCEKPLCVNEGQAKALLEYAREKELFCMEAIWSRFFPSYSHLRERIRKGDLGAIEEVNVELGFPISNVERIRRKHLGGGTVLDLGGYNIQLALQVFQEIPDEIDADGELNEENVDIETNVLLHFPSGGVATMRTSGVENLSNKAVIVGSAGSITLHDFWCPTELTDIDGTIRSYPLPKSKIECIQKNSVGLRYEAEECRKRLLAGDLESAVVSHADSLAVARIQDVIRKKVGVEMAEDYIFKP
ncbi:trans-1,2-dihydrobenzene-1,2-diol dehydrogenase-like [Toxorhynchites rutilus septentrionalis]|uniref:trans-1,2-dihydrobenzene-1,2-diol dehydrogenase-like n=1 Tax=Toxorhynchites rutilus septentrionalis TaxID=329112 RepID=UPI00247A02A8|nr:trans-1,2-dihydrobenzene-1,2-diol dehydrogenase-like [Toxorhynchites rutilus septentrionalis]